MCEHRARKPGYLSVGISFSPRRAISGVAIDRITPRGCRSKKINRRISVSLRVRSPGPVHAGAGLRDVNLFSLIHAFLPLEICPNFWGENLNRYLWQRG